MNKKDNPVPLPSSLTQIDINIIINVLNEKHFHSSPVNNTYRNIMEKLQNGVETNNEQPRHLPRIMRFYKKLPDYREFNIEEVLKIAKNIGISRRTAYDYLNYLKDKNLLYQPRISYFQLIG